MRTMHAEKWTTMTTKYSEAAADREVTPVRIRLTSAQIAALECAGLDLAVDDEERLLAAAFTGKTLEFAAADRDAIYSAIVEAANAEDGMAEDPSRDTDARQAARRARDVLSRLASIALQAGEVVTPARPRPGR